jgi:hypothetical protein
VVGFVCFFRYLGGSIVHYNRGSKGSYNLQDFDTLVNFANDKNLLISHALERIATYINNNDFSDGLKEVMNEYN